MYSYKVSRQRYKQYYATVSLFTLTAYLQITNGQTTSQTMQLTNLSEDGSGKRQEDTTLASDFSLEGITAFEFRKPRSCVFGNVSIFPFTGKIDSTMDHWVLEKDLRYFWGKLCQ
ncbi:hypothetical protein OCU04_005323 [Sclerotinia nivalis]|uniref:Uncharacterized protein n=1 Tax=Sclerotinia nivalis TaxID=352851 RepID=A0A9X0DL34_9HELO|nr:hypothetical protein OCU04_005323 [Sclerotinia nivalis]